MFSNFNKCSYKNDKKLWYFYCVKCKIIWIEKCLQKLKYTWIMSVTILIHVYIQAEK